MENCKWADSRCGPLCPGHINGPIGRHDLRILAVSVNRKSLTVVLARPLHNVGLEVVRPHVYGGGTETRQCPGYSLRRVTQAEIIKFF